MIEVIVSAAIGQEPYETKVQARQHTIITDEPLSLGGKDKGMNPFELLAASLATCTAATLKMYIDRKKWEVGGIRVEVKINYNKAESFTNFDRKISFEDARLTPEALESLYGIANRCPVHKLLEGQVGITTVIQK